MKLVRYRSSELNFGDDLNSEIWPRLAPDLFEEDDTEGFVGIGTIIGLPAEGLSRLHVFSSGVGNDPLTAWQGLDVIWWCVRGPVSARVLGLDADRALTDGAVLTPRIDGFPKAAGDASGVVVVPHFQSLHFEGWERACAFAGFELLDPRAAPQTVVARLASARLVLTESLHAAIFADLYGVPWQAFATSKNFGVAKWIDWMAGLERPFEVTLVPPPDGRALLLHGRRAESFGTRLRFTLDDALAEFNARVAPAPRGFPVKMGLKKLARQAPFASRMLGFTPARTAEGLTRLAAAPTRLTEPKRLEGLQAQMAERLETLRVMRQL